MALRPNYQRICEKQMVKATHGVITNIRLDHLDVMGPTLDEVAKAICGTVPLKSKLFTSEDRIINYVKMVAKKRNTEVFQALGEDVSSKDMEGFRYIEHKVNIGLALKICESLGVDKTIALAEMKTTVPDEGVLTKSIVNEDKKIITFYNGFAANDPESTLMIWSTIEEGMKGNEEKIILLNTRKDRQDRARQLINVIALNMNFNKIALIGESCDLVEEMAIKIGIPPNKIVNIGLTKSVTQFEKLISETEKESIILGIGNMGVGGAELAKYFEKKHIL